MSCAPCLHEPPPVRRAPPAARWHRDQAEQRAVDAFARWLGPVRDSRVAAYAMAPITERETQEVAYILGLDAHGRYNGWREVGRGSRDRVAVSLDVLVQAAAQLGSPWSIFLHNHPSGDARPSDADARLTRDIAGAYACAGMTLVDHVIMGRGQFYSFRERQLWQVQR